MNKIFQTNGKLSEEQELLLMKNFDGECSEPEKTQCEAMLQENSEAKDLVSSWNSLREESQTYFTRCEAQAKAGALESRVMARIEQEIHLQKFYGREARQRNGFLYGLPSFWEKLQVFWGKFQSAPQMLGASLAVGALALGVYWSPGRSPIFPPDISPSQLFSSKQTPSAQQATEAIFSVALQQSLAQRPFPDGGSNLSFSGAGPVQAAPILYSSRVSPHSGVSTGSQDGSTIYPVSGSNLASNLGYLDAPIGMSFAPRFQSEEGEEFASQAKHVRTRITETSALQYEDVDELELEWVRSDGRVQIVPGVRDGGPVLFIRRPHPESRDVESGMSSRANAMHMSMPPPNEPAKFSSEGDPNIR